MSGSEMAGRRRWWQFILRPHAAFSSLFANGPNRFNLLVIFLAGIALMQVWAATFNLGDSIEVGKIMTSTLIVGPITGFLLCALGALFMMNIGCLLDPGHKVGYAYQEFSPPFPLRKLLWQRLLGRERVTAMFQHKALSWYTHGWSVFRSFLQMLAENMSGGRTSYGQLFSAISGTMGIFLLLNAIMVLELAFWGSTHFFSAEGTGLQLVFALAKYLFVGWFAVLWILAVRTAFALDWVRALLGGFVSLLITLAFLLGLLLTVFNLPIFGT